MSSVQYSSTTAHQSLCVECKLLYNSLMKIDINSEITLKQISRDFNFELHNLIQNNLDKPLCYWCPNISKTYASIDTTNAHIDDANSKFAEDGTPDFLIFFNGKLAGLISLSPLDSAKTKTEIGYWLGADFERKGLITTIFPTMLDYAKNNLKLNTVELSTAIPNTRSQQLPIKFNFEKVEIIKNVEILKDGPVDHILWKMKL